jgi:hypothetical protein
MSVSRNAPVGLEAISFLNPTLVFECECLDLTGEVCYREILVRGQARYEDKGDLVWNHGSTLNVGQLRAVLDKLANDPKAALSDEERDAVKSARLAVLHGGTRRLCHTLKVPDLGPWAPVIHGWFGFTAADLAHVPASERDRQDDQESRRAAHDQAHL